MTRNIYLMLAQLIRASFLTAQGFLSEHGREQRGYKHSICHTSIQGRH